ncbi:MAG: TlpA family protein disulfide reductase [Elusimicrobiales bacterium]|nr:TlpA family protein disulfide reductase [Elusimicrobiales bacterium]
MKTSFLSLAAAALLLGACGKKEQPAPAQEQAAVTAQAPITAAPAYQKNDSYFKLPLASGKGDLDLAAYAGKPVLFMFFTETCPFCRKAAPAVERLHKTYGPRGLNVMGICIQEDPEAALNFAKSLGVTFPLAYKGRPVYKAYKAQGVPYIYLLDKTHKLYDVWEGYDEAYDPVMVKAIETVLAKK